MDNQTKNEIVLDFDNLGHKKTIYSNLWINKNPIPLPRWLHLEIVTTSKGSKYLIVCSKIHVDKRTKMTPSYSSEFSDQEIIKDLSVKICDMFL